MKWLQYSELEKKIPGLKDGMFKSPADGEWKKVRHLMMIEISGHWTGDVWYFWWELFEGEKHQQGAEQEEQEARKRWKE